MVIEILRFAGLGVSRRKSGGGVWVYKEMANLKPLYIAIHATLLPPWNWCLFSPCILCQVLQFLFLLSLFEDLPSETNRINFFTGNFICVGGVHSFGTCLNTILVADIFLLTFDRVDLSIFGVEMYNLRTLWFCNQFLWMK